jgi:hypothetical protein
LSREPQKATFSVVTKQAAHVLVLWLGLTAAMGGAEPNPPDAPPVGQFWRLHWHERGLEHGNPAFDAGANEFELLSDTEHHGIEILLPGPCLMVRSPRETKH